MRTHRLFAATTLSVTAVALLTACGPEQSGGADAAASVSAPASPLPASSSSPAGPTPDEVLAKARTAGAKLGSVKITFSQAAPAGRTTGALSVDRAGNCTGTMTVEGSGGGQVVRNSDGDVWLKPDAAFLAGLDNPGGDTGLDDHWFLFPEAGANLGVEFTRFCDLALPVQETAGQAAFESPVATGTKARALPVSVDGVNMLSFKLFEGNKVGAPVLFSTDAEPRLLSLETDNGSSSMKFSEFDQPVRAVPPPSDKVIRTK
ncbi:hypothetical protein ACFC6L_27915 [Kitasatospora phosalacinea]|uniref:hypothetical protein n=1 Tax=Kitasatospora phosalacinea TaxID=2065 RepID=UPI0035DD0F98